MKITDGHKKFIFPKKKLYEKKKKLKKKRMLFNGPHSIDFSSNDDFYITNYYSSEILVFDDNGFLKKKLHNNFLKGPATGFLTQKEISGYLNIG